MERASSRALQCERARNANWHRKWTENGLTKWTGSAGNGLAYLPHTHARGQDSICCGLPTAALHKAKGTRDNNNNWLVTVAQKAETKLPHRDKEGIRDVRERQLELALFVVGAIFGLVVATPLLRPCYAPAQRAYCICGIDLVPPLSAAPVALPMPMPA